MCLAALGEIGQEATPLLPACLTDVTIHTTNTNFGPCWPDTKSLRARDGRGRRFARYESCLSPSASRQVSRATCPGYQRRDWWYRAWSVSQPTLATIKVRSSSAGCP